MAKLAQGLDLNIQGFRIGARDPLNPKVAAVGQDNYIFSKTTRNCDNAKSVERKRCNGWWV